MAQFSPCRYTGPYHEPSCTLTTEMGHETDIEKEFQSAMSKLREDFGNLRRANESIDEGIRRTNEEANKKLEKLRLMKQDDREFAERMPNDGITLDPAGIVDYEDRQFGIEETRDKTVMRLACQSEDLLYWEMELKTRFLKVRLLAGLAPISAIKELSQKELWHLVCEQDNSFLSDQQAPLFTEPLLFAAIRVKNYELVRAVVKECRERLEYSNQEFIIFDTSDSHFRDINDVADVEADSDIRKLLAEWKSEIMQRTYFDPDYYNREDTKEHRVVSPELYPGYLSWHDILRPTEQTTQV